MKRALCTFAAIFIGIFLHAESSFAHAAPVAYEPTASSIVSVAPNKVTIHFSERIDPNASSITVYAPNGSTADNGKSIVDANDAHVFSTAMHASGTGTYTVSWQVVSADDGHFTKGGFIFSVGTKSASSSISQGTFQVQHRSDWPEAITISVELLGEAILLGCLALISALWRVMKKNNVSAHAASQLARKIMILIGAAGLCLLAGGIFYLLLEATNLAIDQSSTFTASFHSFLTTVAGRFTLYRLAMGVIVTTIFAWNVRSILKADRLTKKEIALFILIAIIALMRARVSHAAASDFHPIFSILRNAIHLLAKDVWIGGLVVLVLGFLPILNAEKNLRLTTLSLLAFSNLLMGALVVGGTTGVYIIWLHLKSLSNLFATHWGGYFIALSAYAIALLLLRIYSQRVIQRDLVSACTSKETEMDFVEGSNMLLMEMFIGLAVLLFSSMLIITTPPLLTPHFYEQRVQTNTATITFGEHHFENDKFLVTVDRTNQPSTDSGAAMTVTLTNAEKGIGPLVANMEERFPGGYVFPKTMFSTPGMWTVKVTEQEPHVFDAVGSFTLQYPTDLAFAHRDDNKRTFGLFELLMIVIAIGVVILAYVLYQENKHLQRRCGMTKTVKKIECPAKNLWLAIPVDLAFVIFIGLLLGGHNHGSGGFLRECATFNGVWHENVPMREGQATSDIAALGCMIGAGQGTYHFVDQREFEFFTKPTYIYGTMTTSPSMITAGVPTTLSFHIQDDHGQPIRNLTREHDRILHAVIISQDLNIFAHVHPEDVDTVTQAMQHEATFPVQYTFPKSGKYLVGTTETVGGKTFGNTFSVTVGPHPNNELPMTESALEKTFDGMNVSLSLPTGGLKAGVVQKIAYQFQDNGRPVTNLEPYLSAAMHLSIVSTDLHSLIHTHAELPQTFLESIFNPRDPRLLTVHAFLPDHFGPSLVAYVLFPLPGQYELFGEVNRGGKITVTKYTVEVK